MLMFEDAPEPEDRPYYRNPPQPADLENDSDEDFSASSILRVSEFGWPCIMAIPDRDFDLPVWYETDKFQALGSETGLLLVVGNNRPWMPTEVRAEAHASSVVFRDEKGTRG